MKLSQAFVKSMIGCWTRPGTTLVHTKEKMSVCHGVRGPQKTYFKPYVIHWHSPRGFATGEAKRCSCRKRQGPMAKKYRYNKFLMNFFVGRKEHKDKRRQKNGQTWTFFLSKTVLLRHILKKSARSLFGARSFLLIHIRPTPSERPKNFVNWFFFKKPDHGN